MRTGARLLFQTIQVHPMVSPASILMIVLITCSTVQHPHQVQKFNATNRGVNPLNP